MTWKDKSCEHCVFRVGVECRRFPPSGKRNATDNTNSTYPTVKSGSEGISLIDGYRYRVHIADACAEYAESLDKPLETITEEV